MFTCTSSKGHGLWFVIGGFQSLFFVSRFMILCFVLILFRAIIDELSLRPRFFWSFLFLSLGRRKETMPASFHKKSTPCRDFLCYSKQSRVILSQAGQARYIEICSNLTFTKMIDRTQKPKFAIRAARYNKFRCKGLLEYTNKWHNC